ncbi:J-type chaperone JAC1 [Lachancea thermotolerans CBS 6340]|uniref:KLTH0E07612p n=1 Tax=Lachancea thermotolerans (strain ATCC 56472 / CBS 6340 / NRRL Y-8284) TaxID=559295 RepID=C5DHW2_LACTC|nr:KLTH0E07612p [Lachancea thermotolerans CBS 6340]CAR23373.1 KLTH0E07612p [Lachancea thermotolerans CBS 6340]
MLRIVCKRLYSSRSVFQQFPRTFRSRIWSWNVDLRGLRKEYRDLQALEHPDMNANSDSSRSSELNHAYQTLKQPLLRAQYILETQAGLDLRNEQTSREIAQQDPELLMRVLDVHEQLESLSSEQDVKVIARENRERMNVIEQTLGEAFAQHDWDRAAQLTVELRYWTSLDRAVKEWEPGKRLELNH